MVIYFLKRIQSLIRTPTQYFEWVKTQDSYPNIIKYLIYLLLISFPVHFIIFFLTFNPITYFQSKFPFLLYPELFYNLPTSIRIGYAFGNAISSVISLFIIIHVLVLIYHLFIYVLGSREGFFRTYQSIVYGLTPYIILFSIPYIGYLIVIWSFTLQVKGVKTLHNFSTGKAIGALVTLPAILGVIILFGYLFLSPVIEESIPKTEFSCDLIDDDVDKKKDCYLNLALKNNDPTQCYNAYIGFYNRTKHCLSEYSIYTKDLEICRNLEEEPAIPKNNCLVALAYYIGDVALCNELIDYENEKNEKNCYTNIAKNKEDPSFCDQINYTYTSPYNSDYCYMDVAVYLLDESICENIKLAEDKSICIEEVNENKQQFNKCGNLDEGTEEWDICWKNLAYRAENPTYCDKIYSEKYTQYCQDNIMLTLTF